MAAKTYRKITKVPCKKEKKKCQEKGDCEKSRSEELKWETSEAVELNT